MAGLETDALASSCPVSTVAVAEAARQQLSVQVAEHEAAKAAREAQKRRELEEVNQGYAAFRWVTHRPGR